MATSAPWITTSTSVFEPNLENHFGVAFGTPFTGQYLNNPHAYAVIKPYVPSDDQEMTLTCQKVLDSKMPDTMTGADNASGSKFTLDPLVRNVMTLLDPKDLANLSKVSKCSYSATKTQFVWIVQSNQFFPNVKVMDKSLCSFSPEQQFKIYFKRMNDELKPYICQFKKQDDLLKELRGPNGMDGTVDAAWKEMVKVAGIEAANQVFHQYPNDPQLAAALEVYRELNYQRAALAGHDYNGTDETRSPTSRQGRCLTAIEILVPKAFDDQDKFEKTIQRAEAEKNGTSEAPADPFLPVYSYRDYDTTSEAYTRPTADNATPIADLLDKCIIS